MLFCLTSMHACISGKHWAGFKRTSSKLKSPSNASQPRRLRIHFFRTFDGRQHFRNGFANCEMKKKKIVISYEKEDRWAQGAQTRDFTHSRIHTPLTGRGELTYPHLLKENLLFSPKKKECLARNPFLSTHHTHNNAQANTRHTRHKAHTDKVHRTQTHILINDLRDFGVPRGVWTEVELSGQSVWPTGNTASSRTWRKKKTKQNKTNKTNKQKGIVNFTHASGREKKTSTFDESQHYPTPLQNHSSYVHAVSWNSDGGRICSAGDDKTVRVWEVSSGKCLQTLEGHSSGSLVVFSLLTKEPSQTKENGGRKGGPQKSSTNTHRWTRPTLALSCHHSHCIFCHHCSTTPLSHQKKKMQRDNRKRMRSLLLLKKSLETSFVQVKMHLFVGVA